MAITPEQAQQIFDEADCLYNAVAVERAIERIAKDITKKLQESNPLVLCVMTGGIIPTGMLLPRLNFPLQLDYVHVTRYRGETEGGSLQWIVTPKHSAKDRVVLVIDDISDEGITLSAIVQSCLNVGAKEVLTAVLVNKVHDRKQGIKADYIGLNVEDRYVFGCGMDYKSYLRNLPGIYAEKLKP